MSPLFNASGVAASCLSPTMDVTMDIGLSALRAGSSMSSISSILENDPSETTEKLINQHQMLFISLYCHP